MKTTLLQIAQSLQSLETGLLALALLALSLSGTADSHGGSDFSSANIANQPPLMVVIQDETDRQQASMPLELDDWDEFLDPTDSSHF